MPAEPEFATDLYHGVAESYDRFRLPYAPVLVDDLIGRVLPTGRGRLLDLACGTGQLAFALSDSFAEVWAVDREPDMTRVVAAKGRDRVRAIASDAEDLRTDTAGFELITIGNAFHRLRRDRIAVRALEWLIPGGHLALCWSDPPWAGHADWQRSLKTLLDRWRHTLKVDERLPADWDAARAATPDDVVLAAAGFVPLGRHQWNVEHRWTVAALAGFVYSTSFLTRPVFGDRAAEFEADLASSLSPYGALVDAVNYAYDLFRKPGPIE